MYHFHMIMDGLGYLPVFKYRTLPIVTKLSLDEASPRGNELVVVNADGLQPGCKCIYGPLLGG